MVLTTGHIILARAMIFRMMRGYNNIDKSANLIVLKENISEAYDQYNENKPQIFYFDDFLGSNFLLDRLNRNEDREIINFMDHIKEKSNKWFIMTTREHLLNQAKIHYEKFDHNTLKFSKLILDVGIYTNMVKAQILYNHMYYTKTLSKEYLIEILKENRYLKIIKHRNYIPRLIQYLTVNLDKTIKVGEYYDYILNVLDHPLTIWEKAYENQLSENSKKLLITLVTFENFLDYKVLGKAIPSLKINELKQSLRELEGIFIKLVKWDNGSSIITFHSPSVKDFLISYLINNLDLVTEALSRAISVEQFFGILSWGNLERSYSNKVILNISYQEQITVFLIKVIKDSFTSFDDNQKVHALYKIASNIYEPSFELKVLINDTFYSIDPTNLSGFGYEYYVNIYILYFKLIKSLSIEWFFKFISDSNDIKKFIVFSELRSVLGGFESFTHTGKFVKSLSDAVNSEVSYAKEYGHENEYLDSIIDDIKLIESKYEVKFYNEVEQIKELISNNEDNTSTDEILNNETSNQSNVGDAEIISMFRGLLEINC